jgi:hypothetical protein
MPESMGKEAGKELSISHHLRRMRSNAGSPAARSQKIGRFSFLDMAKELPCLAFNIFCGNIVRKPMFKSPPTNYVTLSDAE